MRVILSFFSLIWLAHFRIAVCLCFKPSLGAQPFKWDSLWNRGQEQFENGVKKVLSLLCSVIGWQNLLLFLSQREGKPKPIMTSTLKFSRAWRPLLCTCGSNSDWFIALCQIWDWSEYLLGNHLFFCWFSGMILRWSHVDKRIFITHGFTPFSFSWRR